MSSERPVSDPAAPRAAFVLSRRALAIAAIAAIAVIAVIALVISGVLARGGMAHTVASSDEVAGQQAAAERHIDRAYAQSVDQVNRARALRLAIPAAQADAIASKALADLSTLRHSGLVALGQAVGLSGDAAEAYAKTAEQAADARRAQPRPSPTPVLLAPRFYTIVARMGELAVRISDDATTALTASPAATPSPSRSPGP